MYKLFVDKAEIFECDVKVKGASLDKSKARLVIESNDVNLLFNGSISKDGKCSIPVKKLKGLLDENQNGKIKLEIICEDTLFTPWEDNFEVQVSKEVVAEVKSQEDKPTISESEVEVINVKKEGEVSDLDHATNLINLFLKEGINLENIHLKKKEIGNIVSTYQTYKPFSEDRYSSIINEVLEGLK